jgi:hypothetical protein
MPQANADQRRAIETALKALAEVPRSGSRVT